MTGISNLTIEKFINESEDGDLKNNFVEVFSSNQIFQFIHFHRFINEKNVQYLFMIMNTGRVNKKGTHWWSLLHTHRNIFLFDSFGFTGLKSL